jgi:hypothetical protein
MMWMAREQPICVGCMPSFDAAAAVWMKYGFSLLNRDPSVRQRA